MAATYREWEGLVTIVALGVIDDSSGSLRCKGLVNCGSNTFRGLLLLVCNLRCIATTTF
jgi:hypothetical protein